MNTRHSPRPLAYTTAEIAVLRRSRRSGSEPTPEEFDRLLATVDALENTIRMQAGRHRDAGDRQQEGA